MLQAIPHQSAESRASHRAYDQALQPTVGRSRIPARQTGAEVEGSYDQDGDSKVRAHVKRPVGEDEQRHCRESDKDINGGSLSATHCELIRLSADGSSESFQMGRTLSKTRLAVWLEAGKRCERSSLVRYRERHWC